MREKLSPQLIAGLTNGVAVTEFRLDLLCFLCVLTVSLLHDFMWVAKPDSSPLQ
jgi:hypothetical protein